MGKFNHKIEYQFQTPPSVCRYMVSLLPNGIRSVLEPTPGLGNLVSALWQYDVTDPVDYFLLDKNRRFDAVVMNPPFSHRTADLENAPKGYGTGLKVGYRILVECMHKSDTVIALMPWFTIGDSDVRLRYLKNFGLISVTALPRKTFQYARIQTVILHLQKGYKGETTFKVFDLLPSVRSMQEASQIELF